MRTKIIIAVIVALVAVGGVTLWYARASAQGHSPYRTEEIKKEDLLASFSATGTLEPEDIIDVGAQVAGQIKEFGVEAANAQYKLDDDSLTALQTVGVPDTIIEKLRPLKDKEVKGQANFLGEVGKLLTSSEMSSYQADVMNSVVAQGKPIDYASDVEAGALLSKIDDSLYAAKVLQSMAMLVVARETWNQAVAKVDDTKANVQVAQAKVQTDQVNLDHAKRDWDRAQVLNPRQAIAPADYDTYLATYETARVTLAQDKAAQAQAEVQVKEAIAAADTAKANIGAADALLKQDRINLSYTKIRAPVKGVVIDRRVTIGQTVQSSFNTPSLFLLARDLKRMKVWASVNEADIGHVHVGQTVKFTVDAYPGETFTGKVDLVRLNATMTNNVVTYTVEVLTDNPVDKDHPNGKLLPYLTANLKFEVDTRKGALTVSNEALRWKPDPKQVASDARAAYQKSMQKRATADAAKEQGAEPVSGSATAATHGTVWVQDGQFVKPVKVKLGLSDGNRTEITGADLQEGTVIVSGDALAVGGDDGSNPFTPQMFGGKKQ